MSSSLSLVAQINETDHFNILKMCDILFSQLCLKVLLATSSGSGDLKWLAKSSSSIDEIGQDTSCQGATEDNDSSFNSLISDMSSMAALLLQGRAVVPMQMTTKGKISSWDGSVRLNSRYKLFLWSWQASGKYPLRNSQAMEGRSSVVTYLKRFRELFDLHPRFEATIVP